MLEKGLIAAVLRQLPAVIHSQSMTMGSLSFNGTPDRYFDGPARDFWVEFKMLKSMPRSGMVVGAYTELQLRWMERRYAHCVTDAPNVFGIVGLPNKTAVIQRTPQEWREGTHVSTAMSVKEIAQWLASFGCLY